MFPYMPLHCVSSTQISVLQKKLEAAQVLLTQHQQVSDHRSRVIVQHFIYFLHDGISLLLSGIVNGVSDDICMYNEIHIWI